VLVSIGIPTFERAESLDRAVRSALAQTHSDLEVVISDNASQDGTEQLGRWFAASDPRVRYVRHEHNRGPTANFNFLFKACRGEYVLMLADDDWLDPGYVAACLQVLGSDEQAVLVAGQARYLRDGTHVYDGVSHEHRRAEPDRRVRDYLAAVDDNGIFYGLTPRDVLLRAWPLPDVLGNDWLHVARIACQGHVRTLETVRVNREVGGTSVDVATILETFGRSAWEGRIPQLVIAWWLMRDIAWGHPVYRQLGWVRRTWFALAAAFASVRWRSLAWHLITPAVADIAGRPRGRPLWGLYLWLTRALGAGRHW
jgi:glycosyltransferase involved in cell wall biosynthesis